MYTRIDLQRPKGKVVFRVDKKLVAVAILGAQQSIQTKIFAVGDFKIEGTRAVRVVRPATPEADIVLRIRDEVKVDFTANIFNARNVKCGEFFVGAILYEVLTSGTNINLVLAVSKRSIGKKLRTDLPVPAQGRDKVTPVDTAFKSAKLVFVAVGKHIRSGISTQVKTVLIVDLMLQFSVEIVEVQPHINRLIRWCAGLDDRLKDEVGISTAARHQKAGFARVDGALQGKLGGDKPDSPFAVPFLQVALLHVDLQHTR